MGRNLGVHVILTVKNIKTFRGHDGQGYNCDVYADGVKAAYVTELAYGGELQIDYVNREMRQKLQTWEKEQPRVTADNIFPEGRDFDIAVFIEGLVYAELNKRRVAAQYKRWLKTKVCFQLPGDKPEEFRTVVHGGREDAVKAEVLRRYPAAKFLQANGEVA
jgi:hypothetical protein